ncbi:MAG: DUF6449 domain-containing protein, partial [Butyricicoccaceae bacterium]
MISNRSSFKLSALLRSEVRQQLPLLFVSMVASFLTMPVQMILFLQDQLKNRSDYEKESEFLAYLKEVLQSQIRHDRGEMLLLIVLAVLAAISIYSYLHSRQQIDFYHALPVSRGRLYAAKYLTGVLIILPAYGIGHVLRCIVVCGYGYGSLLSGLVLDPLLSIIVGFLLVYTISVLCMIVCGNTLVAILVMFWAHFGVGLAAIIGSSLIEEFYPTAVLDGQMLSAAITKLMPIAYMLKLSDYGYLLFEFASGAAVYTGSASNAIDVKWYLAGTIVTILLIALGYVLSRHRKSESAATAIAFRGLRPPLSVLIHAVLTAGGGVLLITTYRFSIPVFALGAVIGALLAHCAVEIIYEMDFSGIKNGWKEFAVYAVIAAAVLTGMNLDITGFNTRIPDREDVVGVDLKAENKSWSAEAFEAQRSFIEDYLWDDEENPFPAGHSFAPLTTAENINSVYQLANLGVEHGAGRVDWYNGSYGIYTVEFKLENGRIFRRKYSIPGEQQDAFDEVSAVAGRMRASKEYRETRQAINLVDPSKVSVLATESIVSMNSDFWAFDGRTQLQEYEDIKLAEKLGLAHLTRDPEQIQTILETLREEFQTLTPDYARTHQPLLVLHTMDADDEAVFRSADHMNYTEEEVIAMMRNAYGAHRNLQNIPVYPCFTKTIALLEQYCGKQQY